ncbi:hypothetical protein L5515_009411 [Caenorhabditis briggsae]|uniref:Uncharacterized protein n=1 Tax=Caenorhabditis briggsae TaxID=6238 RepID=A0AAE9JMZ4_CAEBR|nr:hypothetical protein L5515_009411 [Caenorhabditis briggsae]
MAFEFEITPKSLVISPDNPLQVQVKNCSGKEQDVYLTVHSLLFRILNPTAANKCHETQFYSNMKANETLHFQIGLLDEATLNRPSQDGTYFNSTEGDFTVMYAPDLSAYVNNNSLYVCTYKDTGFYSKSMCADAMNESFPLVLERETEPSKKRRSEHEKYMKNHVKAPDAFKALHDFLVGFFTVQRNNMASSANNGSSIVSGPAEEPDHTIMWIIIGVSSFLVGFLVGGSIGVGVWFITRPKKKQEDERLDRSCTYSLSKEPIFESRPEAGWKRTFKVTLKKDPKGEERTLTHYHCLAGFSDSIDHGDYIYCKSLEGDLSVMYGPELYAEKNANSVYEMIDFWNHYEVQQHKPFKLELTPKQYVISLDNPKPIQAQVKNNTEVDQDVSVIVYSLFFRIAEAGWVEDFHTSINKTIKPNETLKFEIGIWDDAKLSLPFESSHSQYFGLEHMEGRLCISHSPTSVERNACNVEFEMLAEYYSKSESGFCSIDLVPERETEFIKKRKVEFEEFRAKEEEEKKEFRQGEPKKKNKKCPKCSIM